MKRLREKERKLIAKLNAKGLTNSQISAALGITLDQVSYWLERFGRKPNREDRARPVEEHIKDCGCRLIVYSKSIVVRVCKKDLSRTPRKIEQLAEQLFSISDLKIPQDPEPPESKIRTMLLDEEELVQPPVPLR